MSIQYCCDLPPNVFGWTVGTYSFNLIIVFFHFILVIRATRIAPLQFNKHDAKKNQPKNVFFILTMKFESINFELKNEEITAEKAVDDGMMMNR